MRGIKTQKTRIRKAIFAEVARLAYEGGGKEELEKLPYKIIPGEVATYRDSIFVERAIVSERLRVALGMSIRPMTEPAPISQGLDQSMIGEKYYEPPLIDIIKFACHACPEKRVYATDGCQGCFEHPCVEVCPKGAIKLVNGRSVVDQEKCIKCGRCIGACPYHAIVKQERPCAMACGMKAIGSDQYGRAEIDHKKCVSCGMCLVNCPFSAIVDKGQIYQTITAIKSDTPVYAIVAPAFAGQFPNLKPEQVRSLFKALGFMEVASVATGADICTIEEAKDFLKEVPDEKPFMATSCCPAWSVMVKNEFPDQADCISMAMTPMVLTARLVKMVHPECKIAFIGPCAAKKLEASRRTIKSYVDFVLTFEEVAGMVEAKGIKIEDLPADRLLREASADGMGFAAAGGVAQAVVNYVKKLDPEREVKTAAAAGLEECKKMMMMAKAGKYNGYLLEGMACPGGCIAGAGTIADAPKAAKALLEVEKQTIYREAAETSYAEWLPTLEHFDLHEWTKELED
ncbi:MAG: 4Fe-4S dicluster domain-containing protein [Lachnospiraceae bacterium]|nr:4Fe-4S dicluster domain-containing protein [Lachnospiraceae bacterium]